MQAEDEEKELAAMSADERKRHKQRARKEAQRAQKEAEARAKEAEAAAAVKEREAKKKAEEAGAKKAPPAPKKCAGRHCSTESCSMPYHTTGGGSASAAHTDHSRCSRNVAPGYIRILLLLRVRESLSRIFLFGA